MKLNIKVVFYKHPKRGQKVLILLADAHANKLLTTVIITDFCQQTATMKAMMIATRMTDWTIRMPPTAVTEVMLPPCVSA